MNPILLRLLIEKYWLQLTLMLLATITFLSLKPTGITMPVEGFDKIYHCLAYAALMFPIAFKKPANWWLMMLTLVVYSGAIELFQPMIGRHGDWIDFAMNLTGMLIGAMLGSHIRKHPVKH